MPSGPAGVFASLVALSERIPDQTCLDDGKRQFTWKQLLRRSSRIAGFLTTLETPRRQPIAILVRDSIKALASSIGVLGAGRPVLFLEHRQHRDRLRDLTTVCGIRIVLTDEQSLQLAKEIAPNATLVRADDLLETGQNAVPRSQPGMATEPADPFAVTCTSGSTGNPKVFCRNHAAVHGGALAYQTATSLGLDDRLLICSPPTYGLGLHGAFSALLCGAAVLPANFQGLAPTALDSLLSTRRPTLILGTPGVLRTLAAIGSAESFTSVRGVTSAGESLRWEDAAALHTVLPPQAFIENAYGLSECGGIVCRGKIARPPVPQFAGLPPVGHPVSGFVLAAITSEGAAAVGVTGEMEISGTQLPTTFPDSAHPIAVRPGDLGRMLPDGSWQLAGRTDDRVKINGYFVSLTQVETALASHPAVADVAAAVHPSNPNELAVWLVERPGFAAVPRDLRHHLQSRIAGPVFLAPHFALVTALPRMPGGKIDFPALAAAPFHSESESTADLSLDDASLTQWICDAWSEALGRRPASADADFFCSGGDSLAALHLCANLSRQVNRKLSVDLVVQHPSPSLLAEALRASPQSTALPPVLDILRPGTVNDRAMLAFPGGVGAADLFASLAAILAPLNLQEALIGLRPDSLAAGILPTDSVETLAHDLFTQLRQQFSGVTHWTIFAGCLAAGLAFETSRLLSASGISMQIISLDGAPPEFYATREQRSHFLETAGSPPRRRYFELLLEAALKPWHANLNLLLSSEYAEHPAPPELGWPRYALGQITSHIFTGDHLTYLRLRRPALTDALREILHLPLAEGSERLTS